VLAASEYSNLTPYINSNLYATVSPAGTFTYMWYKNSFLLPGASAATLPVNVDGFGQYNVTVTDVNGCTSASNRVTIADSANNTVFVYPNPSTGQFQVRYHSRNASSEAYSVIVYDSKGAKVFSKQFAIAAPYSKMDVNLKNCNSGVYSLEVRDSKGKKLGSSSVVVSK
jgi:hypothetical protein